MLRANTGEGVKTTQVKSYPPILDQGMLVQGMFANPQMLISIQEKVSRGELSPGAYSPEELAQAGISSKFAVTVMDDGKAFAMYPKMIGKGGYGTVHLIQDAEGNLEVQKRMKVNTPVRKSSCDYEIDALRHQHGRVNTVEIKVGEVVDEVIFTQPLGGSLPLDKLSQLNLNDEQMLRVLNDITVKLDQVHKNGTVHLDIKPDNILINPLTLEVTIIDYGVSKTMVNGEAVATLNGSPSHMAPELFNHFLHNIHKKQEAIRQTSSTIRKVMSGMSVNDGERQKEDVDAIVENYASKVSELDNLKQTKQHVDSLIQAYESQKKKPKAVKKALKELYVERDALHKRVSTASDELDQLDLSGNIKKYLRLLDEREQLKSELKQACDKEFTYTAKTDVASLGRTFEDLIQNNPNLKQNPEIAELIKAMRNKDAGARPELDSISTILEAQISAVHTESIGIVDIDEYHKLSPDNKIKFTERLTNFSKIQLVSRQASVDDFVLQTVHRELFDGLTQISGRYIEVSSEVIHGPALAVARDVPGGIELPMPRTSGLESKAQSAPVQRLPKQVDPDETLHGRLMQPQMFARIRQCLEKGELKIPKSEYVKKNQGLITKEALAKVGIQTPFDIMVRENEGQYEIDVLYYGSEKDKHVGKGATGEVTVAMREDGTYVALKSMSITVNRYMAMTGVNVPVEYTCLDSLGKAYSYNLYEKNDQLKHGMAMKYVHGVPLDKANLSPAQHLKVMRDIAAELEKAAEKGIIYSDMKPENIIVHVSPSGYVELVDFGNVIHLDPGQLEAKGGIQGTRDYLPPEHWKILMMNGSFVKYNEASDIYSLGISYAETLGLTKDDTLLGVLGESAFIDAQGLINNMEIENKSKFMNEMLMHKFHKVLNTVSTDDEAFNSDKAKAAIPDPAQRREILAFLQRMTDLDPSKRPTRREVTEFFQKQYATRPDKEVSIGVINLREFSERYQHADFAEREQLIAELQVYDEVALMLPDAELDSSFTQYWVSVLEGEGLPINCQDVAYGTSNQQALVGHIEACYNANDKDSNFTFEQVSLPQQKVEQTQERAAMPERELQKFTDMRSKYKGIGTSTGKEVEQDAEQSARIGKAH